MLLWDVKVFIFYYDCYIIFCRLDFILQLKCVGGIVGCDFYILKVIQCQNKGWDGYDVQWECKMDLDIVYKFGKIVVSCEGYEFFEDQYVLRGFCGLEYNLDYIEFGLQKLKEFGKQYGFVFFFDYYYKWFLVDFCNMSGLIIIVVFFGIVFVVYKLFLSDGQYFFLLYFEYFLFFYCYQRFINLVGFFFLGFKFEFIGLQNIGYGVIFGFGSVFIG